jgi:hypothetical protein
VCCSCHTLKCFSSYSPNNSTDLILVLLPFHGIFCHSITMSKFCLYIVMAFCPTYSTNVLTSCVSFPLWLWNTFASTSRSTSECDWLPIFPAASFYSQVTPRWSTLRCKIVVTRILELRLRLILQLHYSGILFPSCVRSSTLLFSRSFLFKSVLNMYMAYGNVTRSVTCLLTL